jgi:hypothetical protein
MFPRYPAAGRLRNLTKTAILGALLLFPFLAPGCASGPGESRFRRHFDGDIWGDALAEQVQNPWRAVPEATELVTSLALIPADNAIHDSLSESNPSSNASLPGDILQYCAIGLPLAWGGVAWAKGDHAEELETAGEALAATGIATLVLKSITNRERPDGSNNDSFPSGHTSAAFAGATLLADFIEKDWHTHWGYLLYIPATYVGINRIQVDKHWATDVAAGAFIGTFFSNLFFDLHFGDESRGHEGVFNPTEAHWAIGPDITDRHTGVLLHCDF